MTEIETFLFRSTKVHWVYGFDLHPSALHLTIAPYAAPSDIIGASFVDLTLDSVDRDYCDAEDGELKLPWDIIGFDCDADANEFWRFCLHTSGGEWCFRSRWPTVT